MPEITTRINVGGGVHLDTLSIVLITITSPRSGKQEGEDRPSLRQRLRPTGEPFTQPFSAVCAVGVLSAFRCGGDDGNRTREDPSDAPHPEVNEAQFAGRRESSGQAQS
jgi:hypothetical protein